MYEEAILLLEKCITEDYSHERAHTLLSQCLVKKYKCGNKINGDNESGMGKCQKEVKDMGKYDTTFRTHHINTKNIRIKRKARNRKAKMNLILSFATKVSVDKDKKKLDDVISSYFKSFHFLRRNIMGKTKENNDDDNNNNQEKRRKRKNDNNYYEEHDINVTSTATLTHNNNHNHKTHQKKLDYYTIKKPDDVVELNQKEEYKTKKEITTVLSPYQRNVIKDTWKEISLHRKFYTNLSKLFPNQVIQINHLKKTEGEEDDISVQNK